MIALEKNDLLLRACAGESVERPPVWMMRQAGRYLPEYRAVRARADFLTMVRTPELAVEVTLQPVDLVGVDAAIIFSDILVIPQAMGMPLTVDEGSRARASHAPLRTAAELARLRDSDSHDGQLGYVLDAHPARPPRARRPRAADRVRRVRPWTLASYMIEGQGTKQLHRRQARAGRSTGAGARAARAAGRGGRRASSCAQVAAGAQVVQLFDSWAGALGPEDFRTFALPYLAKAVAIARHGRRAGHRLFARGWLGARGDRRGHAGRRDRGGLARGAGTARAATRAASRRSQGNLDPCWLYGTTSRDPTAHSCDARRASGGPATSPTSATASSPIRRWPAPGRSSMRSRNGAAGDRGARRNHDAAAGHRLGGIHSRRDHRVLRRCRSGRRVHRGGWERPGGGGGVSRRLDEGNTFEKAGVNRSAVEGALDRELAVRLALPPEAAEGCRFFATGVSLVVHPRSPRVPTVHLNVRYFELVNATGEVIDAWFGGGTDLTPYVPDAGRCAPLSPGAGRYLRPASCRLLPEVQGLVRSLLREHAPQQRGAWRGRDLLRQSSGGGGSASSR